MDESVVMISEDPIYARRREKLWRYCLRTFPLIYHLVYEHNLTRNPEYYGIVVVERRRRTVTPPIIDNDEE